MFFDFLAREHPAVRAVVAATRGNHGQSVAFAATSRGLTATVVVPHGNSVEKNAAMRAFGATVIERGEDFQAARECAEALARERGWSMVPSFHRELVRGVANDALELFGAVRHLDAVYVRIGLGSASAVSSRRAMRSVSRPRSSASSATAIRHTHDRSRPGRR